jgi:hypothetical protein
MLAFKAFALSDTSMEMRKDFSCKSLDGSLKRSASRFGGLKRKSELARELFMVGCVLPCMFVITGRRWQGKSSFNTFFGELARKSSGKALETHVLVCIR